MLNIRKQLRACRYIQLHTHISSKANLHYLFIDLPCQQNAGEIQN